MRAALPSAMLLRLIQATPEQYAAVERILGMQESGGMTEAADRSMPAEGRFVFRLSGSQWRIVFEGRPEFHIEDTLGAKYLDYLLHHPNQTISAFELEVAIAPEKGQAREKDSLQPGIDGAAARHYLRALDELRARRDEAVDQGQHAEVERIEAELEMIATELKRRGRLVDTGERARGNVSKAIRAMGRKLRSWDQHARAFAEHIERFVSTGYQCVYHQMSGRIWQ